MADNYSDDDPDAAAMAEAMGFTGFGMQRSKKRKQPDPPSQTGANNAPLGKRRLPMNLPKPVVSGSDGDGADGNPEEIDLDEDDDGEGGVDVGTAGDVDEHGDEGDTVVSERAAALTVDDGPSIPVHQQHHHSLPPRPQHHQHQQNRHHGAPRPGGRGHGGQTPWWEGTWDPRLISRMIENPWDRLEKQRGLEARGTWPSPAAARGSGGPAAAAAAAAAASRDNDNEGVEDMGSSAGVAATAKA